MGHCFGSEEMMPSTPRPLFRGRTPSCGKINLVLWPAARRTCRSFTTDVTRRRSEEHTSELQSRFDLVCRLLLEKKKKKKKKKKKINKVKQNKQKRTKISKNTDNQ